MLSQEQTNFETQQTNALPNIFGFGISGAKMRKRSGIPTLAERRFCACKKFAESLSTSARFAHWLPKRQPSAYAQRSGVDYHQYVEEKLN